MFFNYALAFVQQFPVVAYILFALFIVIPVNHIYLNFMAQRFRIGNRTWFVPPHNSLPYDRSCLIETHFFENHETNQGLGAYLCKLVALGPFVLVHNLAMISWFLVVKIHDFFDCHYTQGNQWYYFERYYLGNMRAFTEDKGAFHA